MAILQYHCLPETLENIQMWQLLKIHTLLLGIDIFMLS